MIKVEISALAVDSTTNAPIVLLKEENGTRILPVWIGFFEASAIAMAQAYSEGKVERPLTHDLIRLILTGLDASLQKVLIDSLDGATYKAKLLLHKDSKEIIIDARPSDSIALALRTGTSVFVSEELLNSVNKDDSSTMDMEKIKSNLREIDPSDFGKFRFE